MKTSAILVLALATTALAAPKKARAQEVYTQRENTQMREGPGSFYPLVGVLPAGKRVTKQKEDGRWIQIKADATEGWVASNTLLPKPPAAGIAPAKGFSSPEASRAAVAAAIRGYGQRFGKTKAATVDDVLALAGSAFTPREYVEFRRTMTSSRQRISDEPRDKEYATSAEEQGVGLGAAARIAATRGLVNDPALVRYVNLVGTWVAEQSSAYDFDFHFYILDDATVNAFAVPGGYIFITRGALDFCQDEAELAGLLAHEIAHVAMRHGLREMGKRAQRAKAQGAMAELEEMAGPTEHDEQVEDLNEFADQAYEIVHKPRTMQAEMEADVLGTLYLWKAGYDADGLMRLIARTAQMKDQKDFFSSEITTRELTAERHQKLSGSVTRLFAAFNSKNRFEDRFRRRGAR